MTTLNPTLLPLAAVQAAVDSAVADYHERVFREQCARDAGLRSLVQPRGWYRVEIMSVHSRQRHFVDVEGCDEFEATREALDQNRHASSAKVVRRYYDGEKLLGNW